MRMKPTPISQRLIDFISLPLATGTRNTPVEHPIASTIKSTPNLNIHSSILAKEPRYEHIYKYLQHVNGNFPANPHNTELVDIFDKIYAHEGAIAQCEILGIETDEFSRSLTSALHHNHFVALIGERGRGKTLLTNRYLTKYTFTLEERNIVWFRIDANKIYKIMKEWNSLSERSVKSNNIINEYFDIHTAFVFFRYSGFLDDERGMSVLFSNIFQDENKEYRSKNKSYLIEVFARWKGIFSRIQNSMANKDRVESEVFVNYFMLRKPECNIEDACYVTKFLFKKLNIREKKIVCFIDGVDNVAWSKRNSKYTSMCNDVANFIQNFSSQYEIHNFSICLVTRPEAFANILRNTRDEGYTSDGMNVSPRIGFEKILIDTHELPKIFVKKDIAAFDENVFEKRRIAALEEYASSTPSSSNSGGLIQIGSALKKQFTEFSKNYLPALNDLISKNLSRVDTSVIDIPGHNMSLKEIKNIDVFISLFNQNARLAVSSRLNAIRSMNLFEDVHRVGAIDSERYLQYTLLAGYFYKFSEDSSGCRHYDPVRPGTVFPNIFWYDTSSASIKNTHRWQGLAGLRLLQIALYFKSFTAEKIMQIARSLFHYDRDVLIDYIECFIAYGLIDIDYNKMAISKENAGDYDFYLNVNIKAFIVAQSSLCDPAFLYFLCLDTPLHSELFSRRKGAVTYHIELDTKGAAREFYPDAQLLNAVTLLRLIRDTDAREMRRVEEECIFGEYGFSDVEHCKGVFEMKYVLDEISTSIVELTIMACNEADRSYWSETKGGNLVSFYDRVKSMLGEQE